MTVVLGVAAVAYLGLSWWFMKERADTSALIALIWAAFFLLMCGITSVR